MTLHGKRLGAVQAAAIFQNGGAQQRPVLEASGLELMTNLQSQGQLRCLTSGWDIPTYNPLPAQVQTGGNILLPLTPTPVHQQSHFLSWLPPATTRISAHHHCFPPTPSSFLQSHLYFSLLTMALPVQTLVGPPSSLRTRLKRPCQASTSATPLSRPSLCPP